jgi:ankyrin repeat protein
MKTKTIILSLFTCTFALPFYASEYFNTLCELIKAHSTATQCLASMGLAVVMPQTRKVIIPAAQQGLAFAHKASIKALVAIGLHEDLHEAVLYGHLDTVKNFIAHGAQINALDYAGKTPLHYATCNRYSSDRLEIVRVLLAAHANIEIQDSEGYTPLLLAVNYDDLDVVSVLLSTHANINTQNFLGETPLLLAAQYNCLDIVKVLLAAHANIEAQGHSGATPLHLAAEYGNLDIVKVLLAAHANIEAQDNDGNTPLHEAAIYNNLAIVKILITAGADSNIKNNQGHTAADIARDLNHQNIFEYLNNVPRLQAELQNAFAQLHKSKDIQSLEYIHSLEAIRSLVDQGAPLVNQQGTSIFEELIDKCEPKPTTADSTSKYPDPSPTDNLVKYIIQHWGTFIRSKATGQTILHSAVKIDDPWITEYALRHEADINALDNKGNAPLHFATSPKMRDKLLRHGADTSLVNQYGQTPLSAQVGTWMSIFQSHPAEQTPNGILQI